MEITNACLQSDHYPNEDTLKSIENIEKRKNLTKVENLEELAKKLGF